MTGSTASNQRDAPRHFLRRFNADRFYSAIFYHVLAAFSQAVFGVYDIEVMLDHEIDTNFRSALLSGFGKENYVPVELDAVALQQQHDHQSGGHVILVIQCSTPIDKAFATQAAKRIGVPLVGLRANHVCMRHDQDWALRSITLYSCDQVRASFHKCESLRVYSCSSKLRFKVTHNVGFVTGGIGTVNSDEVDQVIYGFLADLLPVNQVGLLCVGAHSRKHEKQGRQ